MSRDSTEIPRTNAGDAAEALVKKKGLPLPERPFEAEEQTPRWPWRLGDVSDVDLDELFSFFTGMHAYVIVEVARADGARKTLETQLKLRIEKELLTAEGANVTEKKARAGQLPEVLETTAQVLIVTAQYKLLGALAAGYESKSAACSREMTRRIKEREGRTHG